MNCSIFILIFLTLCEVLSFFTLTNAYVIRETCGKILWQRGIRQTSSFPWAAVLTNNEGKAFCGGTILSKNKVLTAASCIHGKDNAFKFSADDIVVYLGIYNVSASFERGRTSVDVDSIEIHPDWDVYKTSFDADLAVLTLANDVNFNRYIQPICLINTDSEISRITNGYSVSYGRTSNDENGKTVLNPVQIPIKNSNEECFYSNFNLVKISSFRTFCAGHRNGTGMCLGDSGNGLFVMHDNTYYLRGIVSSSLQTRDGCDLYNYSVFTNIPSFYEWINQIINGEIVQTTTKEIKSTTLRSPSLRYFGRERFESATLIETTLRTTLRTSTTATVTKSSSRYSFNRNENSTTGINDCKHWFRFCSFGL